MDVVKGDGKINSTYTCDGLRIAIDEMAMSLQPATFAVLVKAKLFW
jgi:hypothetical protein